MPVRAFAFESSLFARATSFSYLRVRKTCSCSLAQKRKGHERQLRFVKSASRRKKRQISWRDAEFLLVGLPDIDRGPLPAGGREIAPLVDVFRGAMKVEGPAVEADEV